MPTQCQPPAPGRPNVVPVHVKSHCHWQWVLSGCGEVLGGLQDCPGKIAGATLRDPLAAQCLTWKSAYPTSIGWSRSSLAMVAILWWSRKCSSKLDANISSSAIRYVCSIPGSKWPNHSPKCVLISSAVLVQMDGLQYASFCLGEVQALCEQRSTIYHKSGKICYHSTSKLVDTGLIA